MRIAVPHHTSRISARATIEQKVAMLVSQYGGRVDDLQHEWFGDTLDFRGKARGFQLRGRVEVTDDEIIIDAELPLLATPFEPRIREAVTREAEMMFRPTEAYAINVPTGDLPQGG